MAVPCELQPGGLGVKASCMYFQGLIEFCGCRAKWGIWKQQQGSIVLRQSDLKKFRHPDWKLSYQCEPCVYVLHVLFFLPHTMFFAKEKRSPCWSTPANATVRDQYPPHIRLSWCSLGSYSSSQNQGLLILPVGFLCQRAIGRLGSALAQLAATSVWAALWSQ